MTGLFEKDFCILKQRTTYFLLLLGVAVMLSLTTSLSFVVGYLTIVSAFLALSTLSYDELDNGYPFLMTLPITEKIYVIEKYLFSAIVSVFAWLISIAVPLATSALRGVQLPGITELLPCSAFLLCSILLVGINIPIQLKYGQEKSRTVLLAFAGIAAVVIYFGRQIALTLHIPLDRILNEVEKLSDLAICLCLIAITLIIVVVSAYISISIMQKKQY